MTIRELHPLLTHHIVNTFGWPSLRPLQRQAVGPLLAGDHVLLIAPTAGGKTEAAAFPIFSRMLTEEWSGLSVLYLCPLRALLNNLEPGLRGCGDLMGRRVGLWHGDVADTARERIRRDPPDVLLTTPESVEATLISSKTDHAWLFRDLRAIVVDEIHAFGGDDRGWHLLSVVQRLQRLAGREPQRVGLSATVGEPASLLSWLCAGADGPRTLLVPPPTERVAPDVTLDYVGSLANAAIVLSRLHRGEKRLVFVDSRARVEELSRELRRLDVRTWLSHGSLGREERVAAEHAFATSPDGVILATSTMELGIDVGDLDRVIQIDAPWTVAGFLQRLGRTGRRPGAVANCLFLSTTDRALRDSLGLLTAWADGWVEPVEAPPLPLHVLVQQLLALLCQEGALGRWTWSEWLGEPLVLGADVNARVGDVMAHLVRTDVLTLDGDLLQLGPEAERRFGRRNYLDLTGVFADPPTLSVLHGRTELGQIHVRSLMRGNQGGPAVVLIAGRDWRVQHIDWKRHVVYVTPAESIKGRPQWIGTGAGQSAELARATRTALVDRDPGDVHLSKRAIAAIAKLRSSFDWLDAGSSSHIVQDPDGATWWWTFAGTAANVELSTRLGGLALATPASGLAVRLVDGTTHRELRAQLESGSAAASLKPPDDIVKANKFADVVPGDALVAMLDARDRDPQSVRATMRAPVNTHRSIHRAPRP